MALAVNKQCKVAMTILAWGRMKEHVTKRRQELEHRRNDYFGLGRNERTIESAEFTVERSRYFGIFDVIDSIRSITILSIGKDERGKGLQTPVYGKVNSTLHLKN